MDFDLYWHAIRWLALEHLHVETREGEIHADSVIVGSFKGAPLRLRYGLVCDRAWRATRVHVEDLATGACIELERHANGTWRDRARCERPELDTAIDVDIAATPFTNTLPIRRLRLEQGQSADITVVFIAISPTLSVGASRQRYTCLRGEANRASGYLYESLESDFKRELTVDQHGFVVDYPGIWRRVDTDFPDTGSVARQRG